MKQLFQSFYESLLKLLNKITIVKLAFVTTLLSTVIIKFYVKNVIVS